jgi:flagellin
MERNVERLSSGLRINKAADDAAGLAISERMGNRVRGMQQAHRNVQQGNNMLQTAEGATNEIGNILGRMRELAVQGASDTVGSSDRSSLKLEFDQLKSEVTRIAQSTEYNGNKLIDGAFASKLDTAAGTVDTITTATTTINAGGKITAAGTYDITVDDAAGANTEAIDAGDTITLNISGGADYVYTLTADDLSGTDLKAGTVMDFKTSGGVDSGIRIKADSDTAVSGFDTKTVVVTTDSATIQVGADSDSNNRLSFTLAPQTEAHLGLDAITLDATASSYQGAITSLDAALTVVNDSRSNIGSIQNRLEYTASNLMASIQNESASMSTIRDADFAAEAADLAKNQILVQSGTAMLAQANGLSQNVLALIR